MENYVDMPDLGVLSSGGVENISKTMPSFDFTDFANSIIKGENVFDPENIFNSFLRIFANELYYAMRMLGVIIALVMISVILENIHSALSKEKTSLSSFICLALIVGLATEIFMNTSVYAAGVSGDITNLMLAMLPVMMSLLAGMGFVTLGIISHPILLFMCNIFALLFDKVLIPVSVAYMAISLTDMLSETVELAKFRELIKKIYNFTLGIVMTLFTGMLGISSYAGVALDSVGARGAKFALSNMVPFVGRSISDAMGAVVSASLVLKNAMGITGIVCIIGLCLIPVLKTAAIILCIRISAAVCEPVAGKRTVQVLTSVGDSLSMINAALLAISVMMIIAIGIILGVK